MNYMSGQSGVLMSNWISNPLRERCESKFINSCFDIRHIRPENGNFRIFQSVHWIKSFDELSIETPGL